MRAICTLALLSTLASAGPDDEAIAVETRAVEKSQQLEDKREFGRALYEMGKRRAEANR